MWERRLEGWDDANGDGIIVPEELMVSDTAEFLGTPYSNQQATVSTDLTWRNMIRVGALLEFRGGGNHGNGTEAFRCALFRCRGLFDRNASLEEQAKAVAWVHHPSQTLGAFSEPGQFAKLREVTLTFFLPSEWVSAIRASNASISVYARNLKTWSPYSGFDPEISARNFGDSFVRNEVLSQPPARLFGFRTSVTF